MLRRALFLTLISIAGLCTVSAVAATVKLTADKTDIGMGESVTLTTRVSTGSSTTRGGHRVLPFVNGKRWGAVETTDEAGVAVHHLPLPTPGTADIQVLVEPPVVQGPRARWIWGPTVPEDTTQYIQHVFDYTGDPAAAALYVAADDAATVYINGRELGPVSGWKEPAVYTDLSGYLEIGPNVISVESKSAGGLAGLLVRMEDGSATRKAVLVSDATWTLYAKAPYAWPFRAEEDGKPVAVLAGVEWSPWRRNMAGWPALEDRSLDRAGTLMPEEDGLVSSTVQVRVERRMLQRPPSNPAQRVGIQYEPWFTPHNATWESSHAIPLTGLYWSWNTDVIRQQMIWLIESGVDFLVVDWTNHLWGKSHWSERGDNTNEIIHATTLLLETLAQLRDEGQPVPTAVLYAGLNNGPSTTVEAVNEEMEWIHNTYVRNPRFAGLFEMYLDKPLMLVHNGGGPDWADSAGASRLDDTQFTVRYQSFQHEFNHHGDGGFWSWMDATLAPTVTAFEGAAEAMTVSSAFFSQGGWKKEGAYGRKGGWTMVEGFKQAILYRPRFLEIHQYQEFAGQWEGFGYGPNKDIYVDSYSVELSDDIEPVSLTAAAYRGDGGWGFYYLNLLRALVDCYHQPEPETTVVALDNPGYGKTITGTTLPLRWSWVGRAPEGFKLLVNGHAQTFPPEATETSIDLAAQSAGELDITLAATGTVARYALSYTEASLPAANPVEASTSTTLVYAP